MRSVNLVRFGLFKAHVGGTSGSEQDKVLRQVPTLVVWVPTLAQTMVEHVRRSASFREQENNPAPLFVGEVLTHVDALETKDYSRTSKTFKDYILQ